MKNCLRIVVAAIAVAMLGVAAAPAEAKWGHGHFGHGDRSGSRTIYRAPAVVARPPAVSYRSAYGYGTYGNSYGNHHHHHHGHHGW